MADIGKEVWKDIIGFEGIYKVSNFGRVKSIGRFDRLGRDVKGWVSFGNTQHSGHLNTILYRDGVRNSFLVHRLVAIHFLYNPNNYPVVMHLDDNPANNHYSNLRWGTHSDNSKDMVNKGRNVLTMLGRKGKDCPASKPVINVLTGEEFDSMTAAAKSIGMGVRCLQGMVSGNRKNRTNFKYK